MMNARKRHVYRNHTICPRCEVDPSHDQRPYLQWSIDTRDRDDRCAEYSHGYATLADAKAAIDGLYEEVAR